MKPSLLLYLALPVLLHGSFCARPLEEIERVIYNPCVVFVGYVNSEYDSLPGNLSYPNTCELLHDTLRMHFYSDSFYVADRIWHGDHMILTILPNDTGSLISTRSVYFHLARYLDQNYSYYVVPADTSALYNNKVEMRALSLSRSRGGSINIDRMTVISTALGGYEDLVIDEGRIWGKVPLIK